jgi:hypothetical protein
MAEASARPSASFENLESLFRAGAELDVIAGHLDRLSAEARLKEVRAFPADLMGQLYDRAGSKKLHMVTFVPETDRAITYSGRNSMPVFQYFSKIFWRPSNGGEVVGYNEQIWRTFSGPGYFVAYDDVEKGEVVFDYTKTPTLRPEGWPEIVPNTGFIASAVYAGMMDYNRPVSSNTVIGRAFKKGKQVAHYLVTRVS